MKIKISLIVCLLITAGYSDGVCIEWTETSTNFTCYPYIDEFDCLVRGLPKKKVPRKSDPLEEYADNCPSCVTHWLSEMNSCKDFCDRVVENVAYAENCPSCGVFERYTLCYIDGSKNWTEPAPD